MSRSPGFHSESTAAPAVSGRSPDWSRLLRATTPDQLLEPVRRWLGPSAVELTLSSDDSRAAPLATWCDRTRSEDGSHRVELLIPGDPRWRLSVDFVGDGPTGNLIEDVVLRLEAWRQARSELERAERALAERSRELDALQLLGHRAAEARTPGQLFEFVGGVLDQDRGLELVVAAYEWDGLPETRALLARPLPESYLVQVEGCAARFLGWPSGIRARRERHRLEGFDEARGRQREFREEDVVLLPLMRRRQPVACLVLVPVGEADERRLRLWYSASNQLSLHLDRILAVREAETDRFRSMVDSMPQGVVLADDRLRLVRANASARRMLEALDPQAGTDLDRLLGGRGLAPLLDEVRRGAALAEGEVRAGHDRIWTVTVSPIGASSGGAGELLLVIADVTERRRMQAQLAHSEKMSTLGQMISGVAHELNNPLASIVGYAQLIRAAKRDDKLPQRLEILAREADRCKKIVHNLLDFARRREPEWRPLSLNQIVTDVASLLRYQLRVDDVAVETRLASGLPSILGEPHQLEQVLVNLMTNARQAIRETGRPGKVVVSTSVTGSTVTLEVADDGPGIAREIRTKIFEPFVTTKGPDEGTGLGLWLVHEVVTAHAGTVEIAEADAGGTVFRIELPVGAPSPVEAASGATRETPGRVGRVLVVDDEEPIARLICDALAVDGHRTECATDAEQALARAAEGRFDLVISDVKMPGMGGEELHVALQRVHPELARNVLLTTGDTLGDESQRLAARTGLEVLPKPFDLSDLRRRVTACLARTEG